MKTQNKTVIDLVKQSLIDNGFDGLYNEDLECGCELADLEPCGEIRSDCTAGYKHPSDKGCDFYIKEHKHDNTKRTFEINGEVFNSPVGNGARTIHPIQFGDSLFFFNDREDVNKLETFIEKLLSEARDKP